MEDRLQAVFDEFSRKTAKHEQADSASTSDQREKQNKPDRSTKLRVNTQHPSHPLGREKLPHLRKLLRSEVPLEGRS
jgi:hypothetical protein